MGTELGAGQRHRAGSASSIGNTEGVRRFAEANGSDSSRPSNLVGIMGHGFDIAYLVLFLCTAAARLVNGQIITVDGGSSVDMLKLGRS